MQFSCSFPYLLTNYIKCVLQKKKKNTIFKMNKWKQKVVSIKLQVNILKSIFCPDSDACVCVVSTAACYKLLPGVQRERENPVSFILSLYYKHLVKGDLLNVKLHLCDFQAEHQWVFHSGWCHHCEHDHGERGRGLQCGSCRNGCQFWLENPTHR